MNVTTTPSKSPRALSCLLAVALTSACASLHSYQVDDIDSSEGPITPFEVKVDDTGINLHQAFAVGESVVDEKSAKRLNTAEDVIALFQVGPSTGNPTLNDTWADGLVASIRDRCPSGRVTGVTTVRETNHYPVVSGEIVAIRGYCIR
jgi:hypothetical protein